MKYRNTLGKDVLKTKMAAGKDSTFDGSMLTNGLLKCGPLWTWIQYKVLYNARHSMTSASGSPWTRRQSVSNIASSPPTR